MDTTFKEFAKIVNANFQAMYIEGHTVLRADIDGDELFKAYLNAFPPGTNEIFRERTEHDCSCCKNFIRNVGNAVVVTDEGTLTSIWNITGMTGRYQAVADALHELVVKSSIRNTFYCSEKKYGAEVTYEQLDDGQVINWDHFYADIPDSLITSEAHHAQKDHRNVLKRALEDFSEGSVEVVLELCESGNLYRGEDKVGQLKAFRELQSRYNDMSTNKELFTWQNLGSPVALLRNSSLGALLININDNMPLEDAVKRYEKMVAPENYKRAKPVVTEKMVKKAVEEIRSLGIEDSLKRRYAHLEDISVNDVLYVNRSTASKMKDELTDTLMGAVTKKSKEPSKGAENIPVDKFISDVLPGASEVLMHFSNEHKGNLFSLVAPEANESPNILKWGNNFSWTYAGGVTDSIKEKVKSAGGNVDAPFRVSLAWDYTDDLDLHCIAPTGEHISYSNRRGYSSGLQLDVDMNAGSPYSEDAVENIFHKDIERMPDGEYHVFVHNYSRRSRGSGFQIEVFTNGESNIYSFEDVVRGNQKVQCFAIKKSGNNFKVHVEPKLKAYNASEELWGIKTQEFHRVGAISHSPNYWGDNATGNRHYLFMLEGCNNPDKSVGLYNEFLSNDLRKHRKVFEVLGSKMLCPESTNQFSGLGFSSTRRAEATFKVDGKPFLVQF